ncbi:hypothetical protein AB1Y20_009201 [Prymnesium parvum]|uniref:NOL1/NOP2/Sun domain family member 4 n=1 Tax=Prymnesium parvum TaxID=97485 RepID=A0AB34K3J3_PRYPA
MRRMVPRGRGGRGGRGRSTADRGGSGGGKASSRAAGLVQLDRHFAAAYGVRWARLRFALLRKVEHVAWRNPYVGRAEALALFEGASAQGWSELSHSSGCSLLVRARASEVESGGGGGEAEACPSPPAAGVAEEGEADSDAVADPSMPQAVAIRRASTQQSLQSHYALDGASPLPALALAPRRGHRVLDLCAAPGGKSLCLAGQLFGGGLEAAGGEGSLLISNDRSAPRRARLRRVLEEFLPAELLCEASELPMRGATPTAAVVTGIDAAQWGRGPAAPSWSATASFHRILIDAPCSSERHFLHGAPDAIWSRARLKRDAALQSAILRNGARLLAVGGRLVYSTCSLADEENDAVVAKLLKHKRHGAGLAAVDPLGGELLEESIAPLLAGVKRTSLGAIMLPDTSRFGPLYWAVLERTAAGGAGEGSDGSSDDGSGHGGDDSDATGEDGSR